MNDKEEAQIAAAIIFLTAGVGTVCNWFIVIFIRRLPTLQNSFGSLTASQALGEAILLSVFTFFYAPMVFFNIEPMKAVSSYFGHILLVCYDVCIYSHLIISLNRLVAIVFPLKYGKLFSDGHTKILTSLVWFVAVVPSIYYYLIVDCRISYYDDFWHFLIKGDTTCSFIAWYLDFIKYEVIVVTIVVVDVFTVYKVRARKIAASRNPVHQFSATNKQAQEINFLKQACMQAFVFVIELITYFYVVNFFDNRWIKFFLSTFSWAAVHTTDSIITLIFNREFRKVINGTLKHVSFRSHEHTIDASVVHTISHVAVHLEADNGSRH